MWRSRAVLHIVMEWSRLRSSSNLTDVAYEQAADSSPFDYFVVDSYLQVHQAVPKTGITTTELSATFIGARLRRTISQSS